MNKLLKWTMGTLLLLALAGATALALRPAPVSVETARIETGRFTVTIEEQGQTRAYQPWVVTAPLAGRLERTQYIEGDQVQAGDVLSHIRVAPDNPRNEAAIRANQAAAQARETASAAALREAESTLDRYRNEARRREQLYERDMIGAEERDFYRQSVEAAEARVHSASASLDAARADAEMARALLIGIDSALDDRVPVLAPTDGTIHRVHERGERVLQAGEAIFSISDNDRLELVMDLLTRDAVRVRSGQRIQLSGWGGDGELEARVRYIEPEAFTKVSALGVEEQRVNVIAELTEANEDLGAGYRFEAAIIVSERDSVLRVPTSALFRQADQWQLFRVSEGRASLSDVQIGQRSRDHAELLDGLSAGDTVILYPSDQIRDGVRVSAD